MKDRLVGTREAGDEIVCREFITDINAGESDATTCEALVMRAEEQASVESLSRWNAVCGESRTHGVKRGKSRR